MSSKLIDSETTESHFLSPVKNVTGLQNPGNKKSWLSSKDRYR